MRSPPFSFHHFIFEIVCTSCIALFGLSSCIFGSADGTLSSPENISATQGDYSDRIVISWSSVSGAYSYNVYRGTASTGPWSTIGTVRYTTFTDTTAATGTTYWYTVAAQDSSGSVLSSMGTAASGWISSSTTLSNDASLASLSVANASLSPSFASSTYVYTVAISSEFTSSTISATPTSSEATVSINGTTTESLSVSLTSDTTAVSIVVVAEDGVTAQSYSLTINTTDAVGTVSAEVD